MSLRKSELSFIDGFTDGRGVAGKKQGKPQMKFDWDKAAKIIREKIKVNENYYFEAGLQGDWAYTGGVIFENGEPVSEDYTYLSSNWAIPTLLICLHGADVESIDCFTTDLDSRFDSDSKWDEASLNLLTP